MIAAETDKGCGACARCACGQGCDRGLDLGLPAHLSERRVHVRERPLQRTLAHVEACGDIRDVQRPALVKAVMDRGLHLAESGSIGRHTTCLSHEEECFRACLLGRLALTSGSLPSTTSQGHPAINEARSGSNLKRAC